MENIEVLSPIIAEAEIQKYTLVSDDIYIKRYSESTIPDWYRNLINNINNTDPHIMALRSAVDMLVSLEPGYNMLFADLASADTSMYNLYSTLASKTDNNIAVIAELQTTKTTATEASAIATTAVQAYLAGGAATAWFTSQVSTYATEQTAIASNVSSLNAQVGGQAVSISTLNSVSIEHTNKLVTLDNSVALINTTSIPALQAQIDGSITTWFQTGVPTIDTIPANTWTTTELKNQHLGDIFYDKNSGYGYRFAYEDINDTPDMGIIYSWIRITDVDVVAALANAATAQSTADGKATVYYSTIAPVLTSTDNGDIWINSTTQVTSVWSGTAWVLPIAQPTSGVVAQLATLEETNDGVVQSFYQAAEPTIGMTYGDWWIDTDAVPKVAYRYEDIDHKNIGTLAWRIDSTSVIGKAFINADLAQTTADGKIKVWYQAIAPAIPDITAGDIGDLWVNTSTSANITQVWSGTAWTDTSNAVSEQAYTWSANAAKILNGPDGSVAGWQVTSGSSQITKMAVVAQDFRIVPSATYNATTGLMDIDTTIPAPFSVVGSDITFNGKVTFTNLTDVPVLGSTPQEVVDAINGGTTTTISGSKITTGSVASNVFAGNVIYNLINGVPATSETYTMKIDLANGSIHIR